MDGSGLNHSYLRYHVSITSVTYQLPHVQSIQESGNWHPPLQFTAISVEANIANTWIIEATFLNARKQNTRFLLWMLGDKILT